VNRLLKSWRHALQNLKTGWRTFRYRMRATAAGRAAWKAAAYLDAPAETRARRRMARDFCRRVNCEEMPARRGFRVLAPDHFNEMREVIAACRALFERKVRGGAGVEQDGRLKARALKHEYLRNLLSNDDLRRTPILVDFALSDAAMGMATRYLGTIPYLNRVDLLYSVPRANSEKVSSQLFHVDPEGLSQVKFFINVFDVGDAEGPFTLIPADDTARVVREVGDLRRKHGKRHTGRYLDDEIAAVGAGDAIVRVKGPEGSGVAVDTSQCLHMGSRVTDGSFRLCLYLQYCITRERGNVFDVERYKHDPIRRLAVEHSLTSAGERISAPHQMAGRN
jgi:hypothetical protein